MHLCTYTYIHICISMLYVYLLSIYFYIVMSHVYTHICMYSFISISLCIFMCIYIHTYTHRYFFVYIYIYIHMHLLESQGSSFQTLGLSFWSVAVWSSLEAAPEPRSLCLCHVSGFWAASYCTSCDVGTCVGTMLHATYCS